MTRSTLKSARHDASRPKLADATRGGREKDSLMTLVADVSANGSRDAGDLVRAAEIAAEQGDLPEAIRYRAAICALRPSDRTARVHLVRALIRSGAFAAANDMVDRLIERTPDSALLLKLKLSLLLEAQDHAVAKRWLASLADHPSASSEVFIQEIVQLLNSARLFGEASAWASRGIALHGRTPLMVRAAAQAAYRARDWEQADPLWAEVVELDPSQARFVALHRARIAVNTDRKDSAIAHYSRALELEADNVEAAQYLIRRAVGGGRLDQAETILAKFEASTGETPTSIWLQAVIASARGDRAQMTAIFERGLALWPNDQLLVLRWSDMLADAGDWTRMATVLERASAADRETTAYLQRQLRLATGRHAPAYEALSLVQRLLAAKPGDEGLLRQLANLLIRTGDRRGGVAALLEGLKLHPRQSAFWQAAASNLLILNETDRIEKLLVDAKSVFSSNTPQDLVAMAEILEAADRIDAALVLAQRAIRLDAGQAAPRALAAQLWEAKGRYVQAWRELVELVEIQAPSNRALGSYARIGAALDNVRHAHEDTIFPDALFEEIHQRASPLPIEDTNPTVLHVTGSLAAGGAERQVAVTVAQMAQRPDLELEPVLVAQDLNPLTGRDFFLPLVQSHGTPVEILVDERAAGSVRSLVASDMRWREDVRLLSALPPDIANVALPLYAILRRRRPRVVHLWQDATAVAGGMAALLAGVPRIVLGARSTRPIERQRARAWLAPGYHTLLQHPEVTLLNNSVNGARDYADWLGIAPERIVTVHNGYDFEAMRARLDVGASDAIRSRMAAGPDDVIIGGVMRCSFEKRPELWTQCLIELCRRDPRVRGVLVGDGPMKPELEAAVADAGLQDRIWFAGRQNPVEPWMAAMDVLFLTSLTEGLPNVLIEAQAIGVPVATMRVGGAPETVCEGKTAIVVDEGSVSEITNAVWPLVCDPARRRQYGAAGKAFTESAFGAEAMTLRLAALYSEFVPATLADPVP